MWDALEQHSHLLVTGEPGAGKSTMSSHLARTLSRLWLRDDSAVDPPITEPVVPLAGCGEAAVPRILLAVDRWSSDELVWYAAKMLTHLAAYPEAKVISRVRALLEHWVPSRFGAHSLIEAWLAVESAGEPILNAIDRGAALDIFDQVWSAQYLLDAGEQAAATELAERALRSRRGRRQEHEKAASVLLKADRAAAVPKLTLLAEQQPLPAWLDGVMRALEPTDVDVERACVLCAQKLLAHPRTDGKELRDALTALLFVEGETVAHSIAEAAWTRPELDFYQRRQVASRLAAVGQLDLARLVWSHLLEWQGYAIEDDVGLVDDLLNAGVKQWAEERIQELIDDPASAPLRVHRLRQMLAWLTVGR